MDVSKLADKTFASESEREAELQKLFEADKVEYECQRGDDKQFPINEKFYYICLKDCLRNASGVDIGTYFFQDMWAAREIYRSNIKHVYDIGSRIDGYIAHLLSMEIQVTLLDIRPFPKKVEGIDFIQANATDLSNIPDNSIETLSSLCALEHFGLGRYTDPIDYNGWKKALLAIKRKIKVGGTFYLSVPVGYECVRFNAHRVFNPMTIVNELLPECILQEFSYIDVQNSRIETCLKSTTSFLNLDLFMQSYVDYCRSTLDFVTKNKLGPQRTGLFVFKKLLFAPPPPIHQNNYLSVDYKCCYNKRAVDKETAFLFICIAFYLRRSAKNFRRSSRLSSSMTPAVTSN